MPVLPLRFLLCAPSILISTPELLAEENAVAFFLTTLRLRFFWRVVLLNHRTPEFGVSRNAFNLGSSSTCLDCLLDWAFFLLSRPVSLNIGFGACDCGSSEIDFLLSHAPQFATDRELSATTSNRVNG